MILLFLPYGITYFKLVLSLQTVPLKKVPSNCVTSSGFLHKTWNFSEKSSHIPYFFALKRCTYLWPRWWFGLFRPKSSSSPWKFLVFQGDEVTRFLRFSKPNFVRKTTWDHWKNYHIKFIFFLVFYESKKYCKGTLFSLKMQYFNKQGQQASSKILKHPDEVITRWRSYKIWRYRYTYPSPLFQAPFSATTKTLRRHSSERRRRSWPAAPPSTTTTTTHCYPHPTAAAGLIIATTVRVWKRPDRCKMCRLLNGRIPYLISSSNSSRVGAMLCTAPRIGLLAMAVPVSLVAVHTGSLPSPPPPPSKLKGRK